MASSSTSDERSIFGEWIRRGCAIEPKLELRDGVALHNFGGAMGWGFITNVKLDAPTPASGNDDITVLKLPHQLVLHPRNSSLYSSLPPNGMLLLPSCVCSLFDSFADN
jgi:hypothetical protein